MYFSMIIKTFSHQCNSIKLKNAKEILFYFHLVGCLLQLANRHFGFLPTFLLTSFHLPLCLSLFLSFSISISLSLAISLVCFIIDFVCIIFKSLFCCVFVCASALSSHFMCYKRLMHLHNAYFLWHQFGMNARWKKYILRSKYEGFVNAVALRCTAPLFNIKLNRSRLFNSTLNGSSAVLFTLYNYGARAQYSIEIRSNEMQCNAMQWNVFTLAHFKLEHCKYSGYNKCILRLKCCSWDFTFFNHFFQIEIISKYLSSNIALIMILFMFEHHFP